MIAAFYDTLIWAVAASWSKIVDGHRHSVPGLIHLFTCFVATTGAPTLYGLSPTPITTRLVVGELRSAIWINVPGSVPANSSEPNAIASASLAKTSTVCPAAAL